MAGTDSSRMQGFDPAAPVVILDRPQMGENIGFAARAMANGGLSQMRLVAPRDGWPNPKSRAAAAGADAVIDGTAVFGRLEDALADLQRVFATTARPRDQIKPVLTPRAAAAEMRALVASGQRVGILFGAERAGLDNDAVALADTVVTVPLNPAFSSLNLSQAVQILSYEWFQAADATPPAVLSEGTTRPATKAELLNFFERLEAALDASGFMHVREKRPIMVRNLRNIFQRMHPTEQEVRTLHGVVAALFRHRDPPDA